jgi:hypothetical protein
MINVPHSTLSGWCRTPSVIMPYFILPSNKAVLNNLGVHASSEYQARGINPGE